MRTFHRSQHLFLKLVSLCYVGDLEVLLSWIIQGLDHGCHGVIEITHKQWEMRSDFDSAYPITLGNTCWMQHPPEPRSIYSSIYAIIGYLEAANNCMAKILLAFPVIPEPRSEKEEEKKVWAHVPLLGGFPSELYFDLRT